MVIWRQKSAQKDRLQNPGQKDRHGNIKKVAIRVADVYSKRLYKKAVLRTTDRQGRHARERSFCWREKICNTMMHLCCQHVDLFATQAEVSATSCTQFRNEVSSGDICQTLESSQTRIDRHCASSIKLLLPSTGSSPVVSHHGKPPCPAHR
jgi:hypothetical protein